MTRSRRPSELSDGSTPRGLDTPVDSTARSAQVVERAGGVQGRSGPTPVASADASPRATSASPRPKPWSAMTEDEQRQVCREDAFREAREQGLPEVMDNPAVYAELGRIFAGADKRGAA